MQDIFTNLIKILDEWGQSFRDNLPQFVAGLIVLLVSLYLARLLSRLTSRSLKRREIDAELSLLIGRMVRWGVVALGAVLALEQAGQDVTALITGLGILGFTVGFALQDVSANFVSGILLLIEQPFNIGDAIEVAGNAGIVDDVNLRATKITAFDGRKLVVPNRDIFTNSIINYSKAERRRIELSIGVAYDSDLEQVQQLALDTVLALEGVMHEPAPTVVFNEFGGSSINFTLYYWVDQVNLDYFSGTSAGVMAIKKAFEEAGIEIPFPIRTLLMSGGAPAEK